MAVRSNGTKPVRRVHTVPAHLLEALLVLVTIALSVSGCSFGGTAADPAPPSSGTIDAGVRTQVIDAALEALREGYCLPMSRGRWSRRFGRTNVVATTTV